MSNTPRRSWRQLIQVFALSASMIVGIIFENLGKNPFSWPDYSRNVPFLCISITAFIVAVILSYTLWSLIKAEQARKDRLVGQEVPLHWYEHGNMMRVSWLAYMVFLPGLCLSGIFLDLAAISHFEMFSWLAGAALLAAVVVDIAAAIVLIAGLFRKRTDSEVARM